MERNLTEGSVFKNIIYFSLPYLQPLFSNSAVIHKTAPPDLIGQALDRLVSVSSMRYRTSTSALSTSSSSRGLTTCVWDISS